MALEAEFPRRRPGTGVGNEPNGAVTAGVAGTVRSGSGDTERFADKETSGLRGLLGVQSPAVALVDVYVKLDEIE